MHKSAYEDARRFVEKYLADRSDLRIADVGSFDVNGTLRPLFDRPGWNYVGLDAVAGPNVDRVLSSAYAWPEIPTASFDVVVSTQTLEHVRHPWRWMPEVACLCKPGGLIYISSPNTWAFHEHPIDCWRVWPDGLKALLEEADVEVLESYFQGPDTTAIGRRSPVNLPSTASPYRLTVLLATSGRETLTQALDSLSRQSWNPTDEVWLVSDGSPTLFVAEQWRNARLPGRLVVLEDGPLCDWGHTPRNRALPQIDGGYVVHLDDDDALAPGALDAVRFAIAQHPEDFFLFRIALPDGTLLWNKRELKEGRVGTALFVHPAGIPLGTFAPRHGGDFAFIAGTLQRNPGRSLHWRTEATHLIRPATHWQNPRFEDVSLRGGSKGREDCQAGWQTFFGRQFRDVSILDVGAGLGFSRSRLQAGGNSVTTQDVAPNLSVDIHEPLRSIPDKSFDVVTAFDVIEHTPAAAAFLHDLARIARLAVVVTTPNVWVWHCGNRFHARELSPPLLSHLLASTPHVQAVDLYASQDPQGHRPCQFPAAKFLNTDWPVLAAVGWVSKPS